jgi:hypothetical protein
MAGFARLNSFHSDNGPECPHCKGTVMTFDVITWNEINELDAEIDVLCIGCGAERRGMISYRRNHELALCSASDIAAIARQIRLTERHDES